MPAFSHRISARLQVLKDAVHTARDFGDAMECANRARSDLLGTGHFTINANITPASPPGQPIVLQRLWSAVPASDPVAGRKIKLPSTWTEQLLRQGRTFLCNGDEALRLHFDDHERLIALGIHAILNVPLAEAGTVVATVNVMGTGHRFGQEEVGIGEAIASAARPWILQRQAALLRALEDDGKLPELVGKVPVSSGRAEKNLQAVNKG